MTEEALKPGDIVKVKSGGPAMTYTEKTEYGSAICVWFDSKGDPQEKTFAPVALEKLA